MGFIEKPERGDYLKRGLGQFAVLSGGRGKKEGVVFLRGVDAPIHTMYSKIKAAFFEFMKFVAWLSSETLCQLFASIENR